MKSQQQGLTSPDLCQHITRTPLNSIVIRGPTVIMGIPFHDQAIARGTLNIGGVDLYDFIDKMCPRSA